MKIILKLFCLLTLMTCEAVAAESHQYNHSIPVCEEKGCFVIADKAQWEKMPKMQGMKVKAGSFVITIPDNVTRVGLGNTVTVFKYDNMPHIVIGREVKTTLLADLGDITLMRAIDIIFTKTPNDYKNTDNIEKEYLRNLMLIKCGFLLNSGMPQIYNKNSMAVYYISSSGKPYNNIAWGFNVKKQDSAIRIESNIDIKIFKNILFSITSEEN